jgi:hypothetical protein
MTGKIGHPARNGQNRAVRTEHTEENMQNRTDSQNKTGRTDQVEQDWQNRTRKTGKTE